MLRYPGSVEGHRDYLAEMPSITTAGPHAADAPPDRIRTAPRNQPGTAGPAHVALRTFEQRNPSTRHPTGLLAGICLRQHRPAADRPAYAGPAAWKRAANTASRATRDAGRTAKTPR